MKKSKYISWIWLKIASFIYIIVEHTFTFCCFVLCKRIIWVKKKKKHKRRYERSSPINYEFVLHLRIVFAKMHQTDHLFIRVYFIQGKCEGYPFKLLLIDLCGSTRFRPEININRKIIEWETVIYRFFYWIWAGFVCIWKRFVRNRLYFYLFRLIFW